MSSGTSGFLPLASTLAAPALLSLGSRKGLLDMLLLGGGNGKSVCEACGEGDAALMRLRKGLLEEKLRPGGGGWRVPGGEKGRLSVIGEGKL